MLLRYSEVSLIGLVNWVLGLEKGTCWKVPFSSFQYCTLPNALLKRISSISAQLQLFPSKNHGWKFLQLLTFEEQDSPMKIQEWYLPQSKQADRQRS